MQHIVYVLLISFGSLSILGIFHFSIYLQQKDKAFRNYAFYLLLMSVFNVVRLLDERLGSFYSLSVYTVGTWDPVLSNLAFLMYVNFLGVILNITVADKLFYRCWRFIQVFVPAFLLLYVILRIAGNPLQIADSVILAASFGCMGFGVVMGFRLLALRKELFYQLIIAGTLVSVSGVLTGLIINAFVYKSGTAFGGLYFLEISMLIEAIFLSAALGYRLKVAYQEREKFQQVMLKETQNRELLALQTARLLQKELDIKEMQTRISKDLHDDIGATLSSLQIYCSLAARLMDEQPGESKKMIEQIASNTEEVMLNMGHIVWAMQASEEDTQTIESRIKGIGYSLLANKNINCDYKIGASIEILCKEPELRKNIVFIAKEAFNNISKHSNAKNVVIDLSGKDQTLFFLISDDGDGFDTSNKKSGNGLKNIRSRTNALGGHLHIDSVTGIGTNIQGTIPLTNISYTKL
ncbi:MAG: histidine kinase [Ferruginibacter sp.]